MTLSTVADVDEAVYLLNFDGIELGVAADGSWSVYYRQPCRFLDPDSLGCRLHGSADKPHVCVQYNPHGCFYRRAFGDGDSAEYLRVDRARMGVVLDALVFDDERRIVAAPTIESLAEVFAGMPIEPSAPNPTVPGPDTSTGLADPCGGCPAYCCSTLLFPVGAPATLSALDYLRFTLGFPGTELVVGESSWHLAVSVTCRHLDGGRCGVYGQPERPLRCQFYDAWQCGYRAVYGPAPQASARVRLEDFPALAACCSFLPDGSATAVPAPAEIAAAVTRGRAADPPDPEPGLVRRQLPLVVLSRPGSGG
jgi:hypothetical protein